VFVDSDVVTLRNLVLNSINKPWIITLINYKSYIWHYYIGNTLIYMSISINVCLVTVIGLIALCNFIIGLSYLYWSFLLSSWHLKTNRNFWNLKLNNSVYETYLVLVEDVSDGLKHRRLDAPKSFPKQLRVEKTDWTPI